MSLIFVNLNVILSDPEEHMNTDMNINSTLAQDKAFGYFWLIWFLVISFLFFSLIIIIIGIISLINYYAETNVVIAGVVRNPELVIEDRKSPKKLIKTEKKRPETSDLFEGSLIGRSSSKELGTNRSGDFDSDKPKSLDSEEVLVLFKAESNSKEQLNMSDKPGPVVKTKKTETKQRQTTNKIV